MNDVKLFDTTLRDGNQARGLSFSLDDKLAIARLLDDFGVHYIEGGWPNPTNPLDVEFFQRARQMEWKTARIACFGSTRRAGKSAAEDRGLSYLLEAECPVVTIFGKSWDLHVDHVLRVSREENLDMIRDTVAFLKAAGREVVYDAEHFFDGWKANPEYALSTLRAAVEGGADWVVLCETNGGMALPWEVERIVAEVGALLPGVKLGIHAHNDTGSGTANSLAAVRGGALQVQGTINGIGERCGNANLVTIIPNLQLKMDLPVVPDLTGLKRLSVAVWEIANLAPDLRAPWVGEAAFAHKGGMHIDGVLKVSRSFEHVDPAQVGNERELIVSDQSGGSLVTARLSEIAPDLAKTDPRVAEILREVKEMESEGWHFEVAEASFHLLAARRLGLFQDPFQVTHYRVTEEMGEVATEATIRVEVGDQTAHTAAFGDGPVGALDAALRKAVTRFFPALESVRLADYKVRVLDGRSSGGNRRGTGACVRVWVQSTDGTRVWNTAGVSENIIEASWKALMDSLYYKLLMDSKPGAPSP
ncbi:MAG: citramalate synthase [Fibrobacteria bacterium]|nr:citramalate synthase [Fibrobacteria bacterium]